MLFLKISTLLNGGYHSGTNPELCQHRTIFRKGLKLEANAMTRNAQNAWVIEEFMKNIIFCLIYNYLSKITPPLKSWCPGIEVSPLTLELVAAFVGQTIRGEKVDISEDGLRALIILSNGNVWRALNILQSSKMHFWGRAGQIPLQVWFCQHSGLDAESRPHHSL